MHKCIHPLLRVLPYIQIKQVDIANVVVWVGIKTTSRELRFGNPQNAPMHLGIANAG